MCRFLCGSLLLLAGCGTGAVSSSARPESKAKPVKPQTDLELLQGKWVQAISDGKSLADKKQIWEFTGKNIRFSSELDPGKRPVWGFDLNPDASPKRMDLTVPQEDKQAIEALGTSKLLAIYQIEGGTLLIHYHGGNFARPKSLLEPHPALPGWARPPMVTLKKLTPAAKAD